MIPSRTPGSAPVFTARLHLSSTEEQDRSRTREERLQAYRRAYWRGYKGRVKRIHGTLKPDIYAALAALAEENGRTIWGQVWAEACAYRHGVILATPEIAAAQRTLITNLRRVGNNLNQLARLGHIEERRGHGLRANPSSGIGEEAMRQLARLEEAVARFEITVGRGGARR